MDGIRIIVDHNAFNVNKEYQWLSSCKSDGAVVIFTGKVRDHNLGSHVCALTLEHYPGMVEKLLNDIAILAKQRWELQRITIIHRVGQLFPGDEIVFVGVTSSHRKAAFSAAEFIMDFLKTKAPFWKQETTDDGKQRWIEAQDLDKQAAERWIK